MPCSDGRGHGRRRALSGRASLAARDRAAVPFVVLTGWIAAVALHASVVVNGSRVFYLDDVQMVGMRYGRNLAEGLGLVWNAGERVEGFTNPAWVLVMAAVHAAGAPDATAALVREGDRVDARVRRAGAVAVRLRRQLAGPHDWADAALLLMLAMNADVVFWAANGFETPLLTALLLWLLTRVIDEAERGAVTAGHDAGRRRAGARAIRRASVDRCRRGRRRRAVTPPRARTSRLALLAGVLPAAARGRAAGVLRRVGAEHVPACA